MAVKWICKNCNREMYSAWARQGQPEVTCIYCGKRFGNPYYIDKRQGDAK